MKKLVIYSLCLLVFTGCGKVYYSSMGRTAQQFEMDKARCMNFANGAYGSQMPVNNGYPTTQQQDIVNLGNSTTNFINAINKNNAFEACLNNLGWYAQ